MRRAGLAAALAALIVPAASAAAVDLRGVDARAYPTIRATVVTSAPAAARPRVRENGQPVAGLRLENLGRAKSVVLAIDRSRSMAGRPFRDATAAARAFVGAKSPADRVEIVGFGRHAVQLTRFSSATIDTDAALREVSLDDRQGTALYDAIALSARALAAEPNGGRVLVVLTDGRDTSSAASVTEAVNAVRSAGAVVYAIALGTDTPPGPLQRVVHATGGALYGAASSDQLSRVYAAIAAELRRTWRVEYVTAARPGDRLELAAIVPGQGTASSGLRLADALGPPPAARPKPSALLPGLVYSALGGFLLALAVAMLVLTACGLVLAAQKGTWLKSRLAPHVEPVTRGAKQPSGGERLAVLTGLFHATEQAFGHRAQWRKLQRLLERGDVPLRTVEFAYLVVGCAMATGLVAAVAGRGTLTILAALFFGGMVPYGVVWMKASRRVKAFENQLPDLLITLAASLKAGHSFKQGIQTVVDEGQEPASKELKRVLTDTRLGRPMDEALADTAERIGSKNFSFVITAVTIQRQVGGSLAGLFDMVAETVRQRQQFARKIRSLTAMGRASAYVLVGLPFFVALAITALNPEYMDPLYHTSTGHKLIFLGLAMMTFGSLVLKKIVSFKG